MTGEILSDDRYDRDDEKKGKKRKAGQKAKKTVRK
jgi:hypothetical protein